MAHSRKYDTVNRFYSTIKPDGSRMWSKQMVRNAVAKAWITAAEYTEITGEAYR